MDVFYTFSKIRNLGKLYKETRNSQFYSIFRCALYAFDTEGNIVSYHKNPKQLYLKWNGDGRNKHYPE